MRSLTGLVNQHERIWLFTGSEKYTKDFLKRAIDEGFIYLNGSEISQEDKGTLWAIHNNLTISHISMLIWCMTYKYIPPDSIIRIDYKKYIDGENDFICHESPIKVNEIKIK